MKKILSTCRASLALFLITESLTGAQQDATATPCSQQGIDDCLALNRLCRLVVVDAAADTGTNNNVDQQQQCTTCQDGFIGFAVTELQTEPCIDIASINQNKLQDFKDMYEPIYRNDEERGGLRDGGGAAALTDDQRLVLLVEIAQFISTHNSQDPPPVYSLALTPWSVDSGVDYAERAGYRYVNVTGTEDELPLAAASRFGTTTGNDQQSGLEPLPDRIDWVEEGAVTFVKDQGRCGCCWATSLCGAMEGAAAIHAIENNYTYVQSLSFQQYISCNDRNYGCNGGNLIIGGLYAVLNQFGGMSTLNDYSYSDYKGDTTETCKVEEKPLAVVPQEPAIVVDFDSPLDFQGRLLKMKQTLAERPISMVIKSSCKTLSNYKKGILTGDGDCACSNVGCIDHAVLMVGYDDTSDPPFIKLKNSWGTKWGEDGYFRIAQTEANGQYGLFGMVAHGVVAGLAFNVTAQVKDKPQSEAVLEWWAWLLIIVASVGAGMGCMLCVRGAIKSRRGNKTLKQEEKEEEDVGPVGDPEEAQ
jgi:C1A family cysteine protease